MELKLNSKSGEELYLAEEFINPFENQQVSCPICKSNSNWAISRNIGMVPAKEDRDTIAWPVVPVLCENCGYTLFVNPSKKKVRVNIEEKQEPEKENKPVDEFKEKEKEEEELSEEAKELAKLFHAMFTVLHEDKE